MKQATRVHTPEVPDGVVDARGLSVAYLSWGADTAPLALLLHGFPDTPRTWVDLGPVLADAGFHVVAPFLRGYAPTTIPDHDTDTRALGEDVIALIAALGRSDAVVVGHDWGADAAHAAAALAPERVRRLVTIAIPHRGPLSPTPKLLWALRHVFALSLPGAARRFARDDYAGVDELVRRWSPTWRYGADELAPVKNAFAAPGCLDAALGYYRATTVRLPEVLKLPISTPTLAIAGADDPGAPVALFHKAGQMFKASYQVAAIPGGHFCHRESPQVLAEVVVPFLTRTEDVRSPTG